MNSALKDVEHWLDELVIGLNLCPFAARPRRQNAIHIEISHAQRNDEIIKQLDTEFCRLSSQASIETSLLVLCGYHSDFFTYCDLLYQGERHLQKSGYEGTYQLASFHPEYQFAGTEPDDKENLTNRAPYPILHVLREDSLSRVIDQYPDTHLIPERNIEQMNLLTSADIQRLFYWLK